MICVIYNFVVNTDDVGLIQGVLPTALLLGPYCITLIMFPQAVYEVKESVLMKRLRSSSVKP